METVQNPAIASLLPVIDNPNVRSFLDMISAAEGTTKHGYNTLFGGGRFDSLADHPRTLFDFTETTGAKNKTSAAGRYQFLSNTWDEQAKKLGLPDFSPQSQDLATINLLRERGILPDVLKGDWQTAVNKAGPIWASLPSSPYPQPRQSEDFVMGMLNNPKNLLANAPVTSDANPIMPNQTENPFAELNEEFRIAAQPKTGAQPSPFDELNAEFALQPVQATQAAPQPQVAEPSPSSSVISALKDFPRQLGLTTRYGIEGLANTASFPIEPMRQAVGAVSGAMGGPQPASISTYGQKLADMLGLPKPREQSIMDKPTGLATVLPSEAVVGDITRSMASAGSFVPAASMLAKGSTGVTKNVLEQLASNPNLQLLSAAGSGYGGGTVRELGGTPLAQMGGAFLGGMAAPLAAGGVKSAVTKVGEKLKPAPSAQDFDQIITLKLNQSGVDFSKLSDQVKRALRNDVQNALRTGGDLDSDALRRLVDFRMVEGATPTKGTITLDPRQVTLEQNLAKTGMNTQDPNLQVLGNVQNRNNAALIEALNKRGAGDVRSPYMLAAGEANVGKIAAADLAKQSATSKLYQAADDLSGGTIPLNRSELVQNIDSALAKANKNVFLPENVRGMINEIAKGETVIQGVKYPVPFDVNALDNLMTTIATASRSTQDGNVKAALKIVRDAIDSTDVRPVKQQFGGNQLVTQAGADYLKTQDLKPKELLDALNKARASHRERMAWQESSKPVEATVNGMQPDQFIRKFVLSGDVADAAAVAQSGSPEATKSAILTYLKDKALGGRSDETGTFGAATFNKTLKDIGDKKLALFFKPDEIEELKRLGRVAEYMTLQPKGSAVNNSNSGALALGAGIDVLANATGLSGFGVGATVAIPLAKMATQKLFQGKINASDQKQALDMAQALANRTPGLTLGQRAVPASIYAGFLSNPDLLRQIGQ